MAAQTQVAIGEAADWLGQWHPLADQLGSADGLATLGSVAAFLSLPPVQDLPSLEYFLESYTQHLLQAFELPAVQRAYLHVAHNEVRELIALDQQMAAEPLLRSFSEASRRVGQAQLQKLRPLRDERVVQRYLSAVESQQAHGWHTLVYGLTLAVYSLPLRQGLLGYAHQTTRSFIYSGARMLRLSEKECRDIFDRLSGTFPERVDALLRPSAVASTTQV